MPNTNEVPTPSEAWPATSIAGRATLAAALAWVAWREPGRAIELPRPARDYAPDPDPVDWLAFLECRTAAERKMRADLGDAWARIQPHFSALRAYGTQCSAGTLPVDSDLKAEAIPNDLFFQPLPSDPRMAIRKRWPLLTIPHRRRRHRDLWRDNDRPACAPSSPRARRNR